MIFTLTGAALAWLFSFSWASILLLMPVVWLLDTACLWVLFLAVMHLKDARDKGKLPGKAIPFAELVLGVGMFQDCSYNLTWAVLMYLDPPKEPLVTARLKRYKYGAATAVWRLRQTEYYAEVALDPFDPSGKHV